MKKKPVRQEPGSGQFIATRLPLARRQVVDYLAEWSHSIKGLFEIDVSEARRMIRRLRRETGASFSLSSYLLHSYAHALDKHKVLQAHIRRRKDLIVFDDIDVATMVVRTVGGTPVPTTYIVRGANNKSPAEIDAEIEAARSDETDSLFASTGRKRPLLLEMLPGILRRIALRIILRRNPIMKKKHFGTVAFSAIHMFAQGFGYGIPITPHPVHLLVGGIEKREVLREGEVVRRDRAMRPSLPICTKLRYVRGNRGRKAGSNAATEVM